MFCPWTSFLTPCFVYCCQAGDRIKVLKQVDKSWLECQVNGKVGRCPVPFVVMEEVPPEEEIEAVVEVRVPPGLYNQTGFRSPKQTDV